MQKNKEQNHIYSMSRLILNFQGVFTFWNNHTLQLNPPLTQLYYLRLEAFATGKLVLPCHVKQLSVHCYPCAYEVIKMRHLFSFSILWPVLFLWTCVAYVSGHKLNIKLTFPKSKQEVNIFDRSMEEKFIYTGYKEIPNGNKSLCFLGNVCLATLY